MDGYYKKLLDQEGKTIEDKEIEDSVPEKWKGQIEKVILINDFACKEATFV